MGSQNARRSYERYLALARAEAQNGNTVGAENYYQYAEHYFRSMSSEREGTQKPSLRRPFVVSTPGDVPVRSDGT